MPLVQYDLIQLEDLVLWLDEHSFTVCDRFVTIWCLDCVVPVVRVDRKGTVTR